MSKEKIDKLGANDGARSVLAEAIAEREDLAREARRAREAVTRAGEIVEAAEARLEAANSTLASWRKDQAARLLATATTGVAPSPEKSAREGRLCGRPERR